MGITLLAGDCRNVLRTLPDKSAQMAVTSPPYWNLRDYGVAGQIGLEASIDDWLVTMVEVFGQVKRVLRDDATLWLNIGDAFNKKQLLMMPARLALALQSDGWFLRSEIVWSKPNPMPESIKDRPTSAHEKVYLLSKRARYYYDGAAVREEAHEDGGRNARNVWEIPTQAFPGAHFATMPTALVERCIRAGSKPGDTVLDPFSGAGTSLLVADRLGRNALGIDLSHQYVAMTRERLEADCPLFSAFVPPPAAPPKDARQTEMFGWEDLHQSAPVTVMPNRVPTGWATGPGSHGTIHPEGRRGAREKSDAGA